MYALWIYQNVKLFAAACGSIVNISITKGAYEYSSAGVKTPTKKSAVSDDLGIEVPSGWSICP